MGVQVDQAGYQHMFGQGDSTDRQIPAECFASRQYVDDCVGGYGDSVLLKNQALRFNRYEPARLDEKVYRLGHA
jgi:hypothetical protein